MQKVVIRELGGPEQLKLEEAAEPRAGADEVLPRDRIARLIRSGPGHYNESQNLGEQLYAAAASGLVYPSVRNPTNECVGLFYPDLTSHVVQAGHFDYHWNGTRVDLFREPTKGKVYRMV